MAIDFFETRAPGFFSWSQAPAFREEAGGIENRRAEMKHYAGDRTIDGVKVTVDGAPLDPRVNFMEFSKNGFEWSYEGPEPRQLALALLADHLGAAAAAKAAVEPFMRAIVANFGNEWEMSSADIDLALAGLAGKAQVSSVLRAKSSI
jgi:hypothetical protein